MIAVHKAPQLPTSPVFHRRAPSAPVVVQPTKTPGLLSLSRPVQARPTPPRSQPRARSPSRRSNKAGAKAAQAADVPSTAVDAPQQKERTPTTVATPERPSRGRNGKGNKEKNARTPSVPPPRRNHHQASPSQSFVAATEMPARRPARSQAPKESANSFDPFLANSSSDESAPSPKQQPAQAAPKLTSRPSGKLARRRQQVPDSPTPAQAKVQSVPARVAAPNRNLSRSVPLSAATRPAPRRSATVEARGPIFPVCDDITDTEDSDAGVPATPPREGSPTWQQVQTFDDVPRSAPLGATSAFAYGAAVQTPSRVSRHRFNPSEAGVFDMSFDEEASADLAQLVFGLKQSAISSARKQQAARDAFFANSQFQNSPSPEDLPSVAF